MLPCKFPFAVRSNDPVGLPGCAGHFARVDKRRRCGRPVSILCDLFVLVAAFWPLAAMAKRARTKVEDSRTPKHSNDAERPSKGGKNLRDAATVRPPHAIHSCMCGSCIVRLARDSPPPPCLPVQASRPPLPRC